MRLWLFSSLLFAFACRGEKAPSAAPQPGDAAIAAARSPAPAATPSAAEPDQEEAPPPVVEPFEWPDSVSSEATALTAADIVSAWDAVIERSRYLARRGDRGAIFGRMGEVIADSQLPMRWLSDETKGEGALRVRVAHDPRLVVQPGLRVVVWGAWEVDAAGRWYWRAERIASLEARDPDEEAAIQALMEIPSVESAPEEALPVSELTADGTIVFVVRRTPQQPSDGWEIFDPGGRVAVARLLLPGDDPSYGAQDYRSADERWQLQRGARYTVAVRWPRRIIEDQLPELSALAVPRRVLDAR